MLHSTLSIPTGQSKNFRLIIGPNSLKKQAYFGSGSPAELSKEEKAILGYLSVERGSTSSFDLLRHFQKTQQNKYLQGMYKNLQNLESYGFISQRKGSERPPERGYAARKYYEITQKGRAAYRQTLTL